MFSRDQPEQKMLELLSLALFKYACQSDSRHLMNEDENENDGVRPSSGHLIKLEATTINCWENAVDECPDHYI